MRKNKGLIATLIFGFISFIFVIFDYLALYDIWQGEQDLTGEWNIVSISFVPILAFYVLFVIFVVVPILNKESLLVGNLKKESKEKKE